MPLTPIALLFAFLLLAAAAVDFLEQRIPNWIVLALAALFVVQAIRHNGEVSWVNQAGTSLALLAIGLGLYAVGQLGAGDAKLMAAVGLWAGAFAVFAMLLLISISGAVFAGLLVAARRLVPWMRWDPHGRRPQALVTGGGVPYGVAIAAGTLLSLRFFPAWLWR